MGGMIANFHCRDLCIIGISMVWLLSSDANISH